MSIKSDSFKNICATCRHLEAVETGREFPRIIDTEYTKFSCRIFGWQTREFYLMAPVEKDPVEMKDFHCDRWEEWIPVHRKEE